MNSTNCDNNPNSSSSGLVKWSCSSCTYENWPASNLCILCRTPRSTSVIENEIRQGLQVSTCELEAVVDSRPNSAELQHPDITGINPSSTECSSCTYVNKSTAFKCEQCFNVLYDPPPDDRRASYTNFPVICSSAAVPLSEVASESAVTSANNQQQTKDKWTCSSCTYENWPKSHHCVMCRMIPTLPVSLTTFCDISHASTTNIRNEILGGRPTVSPQSPPGRSPSETLIHESVMVNSGAVGRRLKATSGVVLSVRDKLWLAACRAVLQCELDPIERYIWSGGHVDRKLTKQDCCLLNASLGRDMPEKRSSDYMDEPIPTDNACSSSIPQHIGASSSTSGNKSRIRAGLTLVDLAIRYGRADLLNLFVAITGLQATSCAISGYNSASSSQSSSPPSSLNSKNNSKHQSVSSKSRQQTHSSSPISGYANPTTMNTAFALAPSLQQLIIRAPGHAQTVMNNSFTNRSRCKWMPCQANSHIARELQETIASAIRYKKGDFSCAYFTEWSTFALPNSITKLPPSVKYLLLSELCDTQAQSELEDDAKAINWWFIPRQKQASCLFALWNRTAGDCLLDSVLQACWGVFDRENYLRRTLAECLCTCEASFYSRWRDYEALQAACHYILDEAQCRRDWDNVLAAAKQPSIYIPLLWERSFCSRNPIVLGYTRGHFTALVPMEPPLSGANPTTPPESASGTAPTSRLPSPRVTSTSQKPSPSLSAATPDVESLESSSLRSSTPPQSVSGTDSSHLDPVVNVPFVYLPLVDRQGGLLPIHFTTEKEADISQVLLRDWLDVISTRRGLPLARLRLQPRHSLVNKMTDEWLDSYRSLARLSTAPTTSGGNVVYASISSSSSSSDHEPATGATNPVRPFPKADS